MKKTITKFIKKIKNKGDDVNVRLAENNKNVIFKESQYMDKLLRKKKIFRRIKIVVCILICIGVNNIDFKSMKLNLEKNITLMIGNVKIEQKLECQVSVDSGKNISIEENEH